MNAAHWAPPGSAHEAIASTAIASTVIVDQPPPRSAHEVIASTAIVSTAIASIAIVSTAIASTVMVSTAIVNRHPPRSEETIHTFWTKIGKHFCMLCFTEDIPFGKVQWCHSNEWILVLPVNTALECNLALSLSSCRLSHQSNSMGQPNFGNIVPVIPSDEYILT